MKRTLLCCGILVAVMVAVDGCKKQESATGTQTAGVNVDINKMAADFASASPEAQQSFSQVRFALRYGQYDKALAELDKLANDASLNDAQKKQVNNLIAQIKQQQARTQAPAGQ